MAHHRTGVLKAAAKNHLSKLVEHQHEMVIPVCVLLDT